MTAETRRVFLKGGTTALAGVAATSAPVAQAQNVRLNPNAKAVMPDGRQLSRQQILMQLGLDPNTAPDAWLSIQGCGGNAAGLKGNQLRGLINRGTIKQNQLDAKSLWNLR